MPTLTVLAVNKTNGLPKVGILVERGPNQERVRVFSFGWFDLIPPSQKALVTAWKASQT